MKINKISLENIRSYVNQQINFPAGSILLAGDVGSGKSSILLALDFVLFGLRTGSLSGGSLLRNGTDRGHVELDFDIDSDNIVIKRSLKKSSNSISQEPGYLIINGEKQHLSPVELKEKILSLFNYPKEFLTKSKSLIYRYTVYTPQEEMKHILQSEKEGRVEILRKVFGIDKYKRINDNSKIFVQHLKGLRKELAGKIADLNEKMDVNAEKEKNALILKKDIEKTEFEIKDIISLTLVENDKIKAINKKLIEANELRNKNNILKLEQEHKKKRLYENDSSLLEIANQIKNIEDDLKHEIKVDVGLIKDKEILTRTLDNGIREENAKLGALKNRVSSAEDIKEKIKKLDFCPLCKQKVTTEHMSEVIKNENEKINNAKKEIIYIEESIKLNEDKIQKLSIELEELRKELNLAESLKIKREYLKEKNKLLERIKQENSALTSEIDNTSKSIKLADEKIAEYKDIERNLERLNEKKNECLEKQKEAELKKNTYETELRTLNNQLSELEKEIEAKKRNKEELFKWTKIQDWLEEHFIKIISLIEKKVMLRVHGDFDSLFQKWFKMLIDEENINVSLDEEFTPIIEQNGHLIDYLYLSGGEKTATALAYRLALNQVINVLISVIKTKNLLILDEPTDGFSETQIDKMSGILNELKMGQIIIVSHEGKIESFVDRVIYLRKNNHITEVYQP